MLGFTQRDDGVHRGALALHELHVDHADPAATLADRCHQSHRPRIGGPQEVGRHRDRLQCVTAMGGARRLGAQGQHHAAMHLGADGPVLVELTVEYPALAARGCFDLAQRHRRRE